jgi:uncharacterized membrane protein YjjB (DUF3815 family)
MTNEVAASSSRGIVQRKPLAILLALTAALWLGVLDYVTGRDLVMSAFYLAPICWLTWNLGRNAGMLMAAACAAIWLAAELMARYTYPHPAIPF